MLKLTITPIDGYGIKRRPLAQWDLNRFTGHCMKEVHPILVRIGTMSRKDRLHDKYINENNLTLMHLVSRIEC